ncbi:hypothetical protein ABEF95_017234 [Exophiala dermatitidis]
MVSAASTGVDFEHNWRPKEKQIVLESDKEDESFLDSTCDDLSPAFDDDEAALDDFVDYCPDAAIKDEEDENGETTGVTDTVEVLLADERPPDMITLEYRT